MKTLSIAIPVYNTELYIKRCLDSLTLKDILEGVPNNEILGLCYSENYQSIKNEVRPFNENLDDLPFPARHLVDNLIYKRPDNGEVQAVIKV